MFTRGCPTFAPKTIGWPLRLEADILWMEEIRYCGWKKSCTTLDGWNPTNMVVSIVMGVPTNGWIISENPIYKWMRGGSIPILGNHYQLWQDFLHRYYGFLLVCLSFLWEVLVEIAQQTLNQNRPCRQKLALIPQVGMWKIEQWETLGFQCQTLMGFVVITGMSSIKMGISMGITLWQSKIATENEACHSMISPPISMGCSKCHFWLHEWIAIQENQKPWFLPFKLLVSCIFSH